MPEYFDQVVECYFAMVLERTSQSDKVIQPLSATTAGSHLTAHNDLSLLGSEWKTDAAPLTGFNKQEPIPGYITKELLGTGGYGEVWKCHAPGGLFKAIKFIYADATSKRASGELRSLNRIKEVRHPFLLSIERIEVIDGNVVIVTELADQSLKRQFQKQRAKGLPGMPREELLGYLRDAADALDYIYDNYSLQHLDIKPENLLLVGNRAKVADFGLIKNLYDRSHSSVEGLTPTYAPPELFEGKPNRHSDQYSLAIVYQEMLTGELPFDGTTAAQLAAQHLHVAPRCRRLPRCDQPIIARALSKDPAQRFANCRALVDTWSKRTRPRPTSAAVAASHAASSAVAERCFTQELGGWFQGPRADRRFRTTTVGAEIDSATGRRTGRLGHATSRFCLSALAARRLECCDNCADEFTIGWARSRRFRRSKCC